MTGNNGKWLHLSDQLIYFGPGGVTRIDTIKNFKSDGTKSDYCTELYEGSKRMTVVKESIDEIHKLLYNNIEN